MKVTLDKRVECQKCGAHVLGTLCVANAWLVIHEKYACPERINAKRQDTETRD
jgi:hypothetical protein